MPNVFTARDLKAALKLPFCYICGDTLNWEESTRDHVPPKGCFAQQDRMHNPVVLPTHSACNNSFNVADESLGQFLSLLRGKSQGQEPLVSDLRPVRFPGGQLTRL